MPVYVLFGILNVAALAQVLNRLYPDHLRLQDDTFLIAGVGQKTCQQISDELDDSGVGSCIVTSLGLYWGRQQSGVCGLDKETWRVNPEGQNR